MNIIDLSKKNENQYQISGLKFDKINILTREINKTILMDYT